MKKIYLLPFLCLFLACQKDEKQINLDNLNGYWEISKVVQKDGKEVQFKFNETVDFIEIKADSTGFRKKVKPQLDSTFIKIGSVENFKVKKENDTLSLHYSTKMSKWIETLISLDKETFIVKNKRGIKYTYKRFKGLLEDDKK